MRKTCRGGAFGSVVDLVSCGVGTPPESEDKLDLLMNAHSKLKYSFPVPLSVPRKLLKTGGSNQAYKRACETASSDVN